MNPATRSLGILAALVLVHCASPDFGDGLGDESGSSESGSPAGKASLPAGGKSGSDTSAPANGSTAPGAPGAPGTPAPAAACDLGKPFGSPTALAGFASGMHVATPHLSHDELTMYFTTHDASGKARLARAVRPSLAAPFAQASLDNVSSSAKDNDPSVSADGSTLWFSSERTGSADRLFMATLVAGTTTFGAPTQVPISTSSADDQHPYFRVAGGGELWFSSTRDGQWDLYVAKKNATGFDAPRRVDELHSSAATRQPMISEDGLTILFASERTGGAGKRDLWMAHRATAMSPFASPEVLSSINSSADEFAGWMSGDGCRIYFSSDRFGAVQRAFVAERPAK